MSEGRYGKHKLENKRKTEEDVRGGHRKIGRPNYVIRKDMKEKRD